MSVNSSSVWCAVITSLTNYMSLSLSINCTELQILSDLIFGNYKNREEL